MEPATRVPGSRERNPNRVPGSLERNPTQVPGSLERNPTRVPGSLERNLTRVPGSWERNQTRVLGSLEPGTHSNFLRKESRRGYERLIVLQNKKKPIVRRVPFLKNETLRNGEP